MVFLLQYKKRYSALIGLNITCGSEIFKDFVSNRITACLFGQVADRCLEIRYSREHAGITGIDIQRSYCQGQTQSLLFLDCFRSPSGQSEATVCIAEVLLSESLQVGFSSHGLQLGTLFGCQYSIHKDLQDGGGPGP